MPNKTKTAQDDALKEIDVTVVAARRPQLLELTLRSFRVNMLRDLRVRRAHVNIDPIWGDDGDAGAVKALCRLYFPDVVFHEPAEPNFCAAIQWTWSQSRSDWFLHLEDDWCLTWRINARRLKKEAALDEVTQISFFNHRKAWRRGVWSRKFTTSPSLIRSDFGRNAANLMDTALDPEKQLYDGRNPELVAATSGYRHRFHGTRLSPLCIADTGRAWRDARNIEKTREDGVSRWSSLTTSPPRHDDRAELDRFEHRLWLSRLLPRV